MRTGHVDREGVRLGFTEAGAGDPPIVLIHGMACDRSHLQPQLHHLSRRHRVVAVDLRGHGASDKPSGTYTTDVFGDDLCALFDRLDLDRPVLVGHSLGGSIALALAARRPEAVGALVLLDSGIRSPDAKHAELRPFYETLGGADHAERIAAFVHQRLFETTDGAELAAAVAACMAATPPHVFMAMAEGVLAFDSARAAAACSVPALIILATRPFADPDVIRTLPPNWQVGQVVGSGHFIQLVVPEQVNAMLDRFLALLPGGGVS